MKRYITTDNMLGRAAVLCLLALCLFFTNCSMIDEDLSDCVVPAVETKLDYELQLVTNMTTEVQTQLTAETDVSVAAVLRAHLSDIFTDYAHDVDLSFYDTSGDSARLHHDEHIMDANQHSYTLYIPRQKYMHLAVANIVDDPLIDLASDDRCHTSQLIIKEPVTPAARVQSGFAAPAAARATAPATTTRATVPADTIDSQNTGLFTARQLMEMIEGINQTFNVRLYMANCAAAVVLDPRGQDTDGIQVYTTGFATAFNIADSTYTFSDPAPIVRTIRMRQTPQIDSLNIDNDTQQGNNIQQESDSLLCFCSVTFPSQEPDTTTVRSGFPAPAPAAAQVPAATRSIIETVEPFIAQPGETALWEVRIYVPQPDGTITETILGIKEPLRAGQLKIIRCWLGENGEVIVPEGFPEVSTSITLDWKPGLEIII